MPEAKNGDKVKVQYAGKLNDGTVFDSSKDREPLEFTIGEGHIIPGFEKAVIGMNPGDSKTETIPVDEAYGPHREEMVMQVGRERFPEDLKPEIGQKLQMQQQGGRTVMVTVIDVTESGVTLDANHPLAGKDLTFDIQLVEIT